MLPLHIIDGDDDKQRLKEQNILLETIAWGAVAECLTSVGCPLKMFGKLDVTATVLNLVCPLLCGMAQAIDDAAVETGADPGTRRRIAAFQAGFIGVATSFSFMAEQAALLGSTMYGLLYILGTLAMTCAVFAAGRVALATGLRMNRPRRALRTGRLVPTAARLLRILVALVALTWLWVLLAPAGAVFEPLAVRQGQREPRLPGRALSSSLAELNALIAISADHASTERPLPMPSKRADVLHLLVGLLMQAAGLALSARIERWSATNATADDPDAASPSRQRMPQSLVRWPPLLCNGLACAVVLLLRTCESASWIGGEDDALLATKLRISGCGALSVCGGLATLLIAPHETVQTGEMGAHDEKRSVHDVHNTRRRQGTRTVALINLALHVQLAAGTAMLLPVVTDWASAAHASRMQH